MHRFFFFLLCYIVLDGCTYDRADDGSSDAEKLSAIKTQTFVYECPDGFGFVARTEADTAWIFLPGNTVSLPQVESDAGTRYSKGGYLFWITGETATIAGSTGKHTDCRNNHTRAIWEHAKLNGVDFRALGNEPGWNLEISNKTDLLLVADYGQHSYRFESARISSSADSHTTVYEASNNGDSIEVTITGVACRDSMSGEAFPATVSVLVNGKHYRGCGKALH